MSAVQPKPLDPTADLLDSNLAAVFEQRVREDPTKIAVQDRHEAVTFGQLNEAANRLAAELLDRGGDTAEPVALLFDQGASLLIATLAVLKAGKFFTQINPIFPDPKVTQILNDLGTRFVVTDGRHVERARSVATDQQCISLEDTESNAADNPQLPIPPDALAYVLYTSGSTGRPKGVMHSHRNVLHFGVRHRSFHLAGEDRHSLVYPPGVHGAIRDTFNAMLYGITLCVYPVMDLGPQSMADWLVEQHVTVLTCVSSVFRQFTQTRIRHTFPDVRLIRFGGEASFRNDVDVVRALFSDHCELHCGLGSTELGPARQFIIGRDTQFAGRRVPMGYPVDDMKLLLLDPASDGIVPISEGETGEIAFASRYLALGYWKQEQLTAEHWRDDPAGGDERIFRTGDLGYLLPDECLVFAGRKDTQVSIRGYRIEPGEVEAALRGHDQVSNAAVVGLTDRQERTYLAAYVVAAGSTQPSVEQLRNYLEGALPPYMMPRSFVFLDQLPQLPNGKIDRRALPAPENNRQGAAATHRPPGTELEQRLVEIWQSVFDNQHMGVDDDFFLLGGDSLMATTLIVQMESCIGRSISMRALVAAPTISRLVHYLSQDAQPITAFALAPIDEQRAGLPLFCIYGVFLYKALAERLGPGQPTYSIYLDAELPLFSRPGSERFRCPTIDELADAYLAQIRAIQPHGPYQLAGVSFGGHVAFEMAHRLCAQGEQVSFLGLFDSYRSGAVHPRNLRGRARLARLGLARKTRGIELQFRRWAARHHQGSDEAVMTALQQHIRDLAKRGYVARPLPCKAVLFKAQQLRGGDDFDVDPMLGWKLFVPAGLDVHEIPGDHLGILKLPNVQVLAEKVRPYLQGGLDEAAA